MLWWGETQWYEGWPRLRPRLGQFYFISRWWKEGWGGSAGGGEHPEPCGSVGPAPGGWDPAPASLFFPAILLSIKCKPGFSFAHPTAGGWMRFPAASALAPGLEPSGFGDRLVLGCTGSPAPWRAHCTPRLWAGGPPWLGHALPWSGAHRAVAEPPSPYRALAPRLGHAHPVGGCPSPYSWATLAPWPPAPHGCLHAMATCSPWLPAPHSRPHSMAGLPLPHGCLHPTLPSPHSCPRPMFALAP